MQLSFLETKTKYNSFSTTLKDKKWNYVTDKEGILVPCKDTKLTLDEALDLIARVVKVEREIYGWKICVTIDNRNVGIYFRFINEKTSSKEGPEDFIKRNWDK